MPGILFFNLYSLMREVNNFVCVSLKALGNKPPVSYLHCCGSFNGVPYNDEFDVLHFKS